MFPKSKLYTDVVFLPNPSHLIPSTPVGNQFNCFLVYHSCISFCKGKQTDRIVFTFLFLSYTKGSGLYIHFCTSLFFLGSHSTSIHGDVHTCGRLSWLRIICYSSSKKWHLFPVPLNSRWPCELLWTIISPGTSAVQVYFCVFLVYWIVFFE